MLASLIVRKRNRVLTIKITAMKTLSRITSALLGVLLATGALAEKPESTMFYMNSRCDYYKTTFTMASHLVVLQFSINGSDSLNFIFDTGVGRTLITELSNPYIVSLNQARQVKVRGLGNSESVDGVLSQGNDLSLGKIYGKDQEILVVPNNLIDLSSRVGHKVNGVIGRSIFERFVVEISYTNRTVQFYNPQKFNRKIHKEEEVIPVELIDGRPFITAIVTINGKEIPVKLLFDTGMSFGLWLDPSTNKDIKPSEVRRQEVLGQGLNGDLSGSISRVEKFQVGKFSFSNVIAAFPDSNSIAETASDNGRNGSVGAEIFRRFNVVIDYQNKRIILRKNSSYKEPFRYDMSGLEFGSIVAGLPFYKIVSVGVNSPAAESGLLENDELKSINGRSAQFLSMPEITEMLRNKEGKTIRVTVLRNGEKVKVKFRLRRMV